MNKKEFAEKENPSPPLFYFADEKNEFAEKENPSPPLANGPPLCMHARVHTHMQPSVHPYLYSPVNQ